MLRPHYKIQIQQITPFYYNKKNGGLPAFTTGTIATKVDRNELFIIDFLHEYEVERGWEKHTDTAKITFPKNVILQTGKKLFHQTGTYNVILGGEQDNVNIAGEEQTSAPLIMRGDIVIIERGYWFFNEQREEQKVSEEIFRGFVTRVDSKIPIEIQCEDNFYLLKRVPVGVSVWGKELVSLCEYMINRVNSVFHDKDQRYPKLSVTDQIDSLTANFSLGHLNIGEVTCAQLLSQIKSQFKLESRFIGNDLYFGFPIYDDKKSTNKYVFEFENNIIEDDLQYSNKGDIVLSAIVNCVTINPTGKTTKDGKAATKRSKESILIYWDLPTASFKFIEKQKNQPFPTNENGERHEFIYAIDPSKGAPSPQTLFEWGKLQLEKYYYTGFKGNFTTFGYPPVKWGDTVLLLSNIFSDRNGMYRVKKVEYKDGINGLVQVIHIDYKVNTPIPTRFKTLSML